MCVMCACVLVKSIFLLTNVSHWHIIDLVLSLLLLLLLFFFPAQINKIYFIKDSFSLLLPIQNVQFSCRDGATDNNGKLSAFLGRLVARKKRKNVFRGADDK